MRERGYSDAAIKTLWEILVPFADYAFNKAHTAGYGLVSYWTAYLKANYPAEYMAALLTWVKDDKDKSALSYLNECRRMGIKVLPPDVNDSDSDFTPRGGDIRFGLSAIRNVGENVVDVDRRGPRAARAGSPTSPTSSARSTSVVCNKRVDRVADQGRSLRLPGSHPRAAWSRSTRRRRCRRRHQARRGRSASSTCSATRDDDDGATGVGVDLADPRGRVGQATLLAYEREMLGLYVSDHPLIGVEHLLAQASECSVLALVNERPNATTATIGDWSPR